jgi:hypothetical protein
MDYATTSSDDLAAAMRTALAQNGTGPAYRRVPRVPRTALPSASPYCWPAGDRHRSSRITSRGGACHPGEVFSPPSADRAALRNTVPQAWLSRRPGLRSLRSPVRRSSLPEAKPRAVRWVESRARNSTGRPDMDDRRCDRTRSRGRAERLGRVKPCESLVTEREGRSAPSASRSGGTEGSALVVMEFAALRRPGEAPIGSGLPLPR